MRKLVHSDNEIVELVVAALAKVEGIEYIESLLGVEFAYTDGTYMSDLVKAANDEDEWPWENLSVDCTTFRKKRNCHFPKSYPALVLYSFADTHDRMGKVMHRMLEYVEQRELMADRPTAQNTPPVLGNT